MTFVPEQPERYVTVKITRREAVVVAKLRKYPFGKFTIHKAAGTITRVETNNSEMIADDDPVDL